MKYADLGRYRVSARWHRHYSQTVGLALGHGSASQSAKHPPSLTTSKFFVEVFSSFGSLAPPKKHRGRERGRLAGRWLRTRYLPAPLYFARSAGAIIYFTFPRSSLYAIERRTDRSPAASC